MDGRRAVCVARFISGVWFHVAAGHAASDGLFA
jgi:hypothetical protein